MTEPGDIVNFDLGKQFLRKTMALPLNGIIGHDFKWPHKTILQW